MEVIIELKALAKVILHTAKYPAYPVNGILLRKQGDTAHRIIDAVPLLHMSKYLSPAMEIALAQVEQHCKESKTEVIGYYQANQSLNDIGPDFIAQRIAEKLAENQSHLLVFMVNNNELSSDLETVPFQVYQLADGKLKVKDTKFKLSPSQSGAFSSISGLIEAKAYRDLIDFDNHLDDIKLDYWANTKLEQSIINFS